MIDRYAGNLPHSFRDSLKTMRIENIQPRELAGAVAQVFALAAEKTMRLDRRWKAEDGAPVFTMAGLYMARGWTQWTQGFQFGNALLCFDFLNDPALLEIGLRHTLNDMTKHLTHIGVHDHGFNTMSTYGQLRRLLVENQIAANAVPIQFVELAIKLSGAVQAARWTRLGDGGGFIYS